MHKKEVVMAPILEKELGVRCRVISNFDTDQFGMFTGEINRVISPIETLRLKCVAALNQTKCDLVVASEGSFGQHPSFFFVPADDELVMFIDKINDIEIVGREISTQTNFGSQLIQDERELDDFLTAKGFPEHAVIMRFTKNGKEIIEKGLTSKHKVVESFHSYHTNGYTTHIETDMRALYNPTRMQVIEKATQKMVQILLSTCPKCDYPGFSIRMQVAGLPCELCSTPTQSTMYNEYVCKKCNFEHLVKFPNGKTVESAMYCDVCNP